MTNSQSETSSDRLPDIKPQSFESRRQDENGASDDAAQLGADIQERQTVAKDPNDPHADEYTPDASFSAVEGYPAQQYGREYPDLESGSDGPRWRTIETSNLEKRGNTYGETGHGIKHG